MASIVWKYVKELKNQSAIDDFEKLHAISFPDDLKQCIKKNNGGRPTLNCFDTNKSKDRVFKTLLSFNQNDIENIFKFFPLQSKDISLIPFASDPGGNFLCIKDGKIVLLFHETDTIETVADSFTDLLNQLH